MRVCLEQLAAKRTRPPFKKGNRDLDYKPNVRLLFHSMTWGEVIRRLKAAGYVEIRTGKGSHRLLKHPVTSKEIWVAVHTKKDAGQLGNRILREAGIQ